MTQRKKLTMMDLVTMFISARNDHPGRKGSMIPKGNSGNTPRFRKTKHQKTYGTKYHGNSLPRT